MTARLLEPTRTGVPRGQTLGAAFDPRNNSVNAMRLLLAALVLVSHSIKFSGGRDPLGRLTATGEDLAVLVDLGTVAVDAFFVLSGFLITRSYLTSRTTGRYLWRRVLRIFPAFWVCLALTAAVFAPAIAVVQRGSLQGVQWTGADSAASYLLHNAALKLTQDGIAGVVDGASLNGSLHTLFYEFLCYLLVAALGLASVLARRPGLVVALLAVTWLAALGQVATEHALGQVLLLRFLVMFLAGLFLHRDRIPLRPWLLLAAAAGVVAGLVVAEAWVLAAPAFAYLLLWIASSPRAARIGARRDLSYGLYIYAWPLQLLVLAAGGDTWSPWAYGAVCLALALTLAYLSWTVVESRALALKSWTPTRPAQFRAQPSRAH